MRALTKLLYFLVISSMILSGCCYLPVPPSRYSSCHQQIISNPTHRIIIGSSSRSDIILELGEPDCRYLNDSLFVYLNIKGEFLSGECVSYGGSRSIAFFSAYRLDVVFDEYGTVKSASYKVMSCSDFPYKSQDCYDLSGMNTFLALLSESRPIRWFGSAYLHKQAEINNSLESGDVESRWLVLGRGWLVVGEWAIEFYTKEMRWVGVDSYFFPKFLSFDYYASDIPTWEINYNYISKIESSSNGYYFKILSNDGIIYNLELRPKFITNPNKTLTDVVSYIESRIARHDDVSSEN